MQTKLVYRGVTRASKQAERSNWETTTERKTEAKGRSRRQKKGREATSDSH